MKLWLLVALLALLGLLAVPLSDEFTRASILGSKGNKETGSKFGLTISMTRDAAAQVLSTHGFEPFDYSLGPEPPPLSCRDTEQDLGRQAEFWFLDERRRRAVICIESRNGELKEFSWDFAWLDL